MEGIRIIRTVKELPEIQREIWTYLAGRDDINVDGALSTPGDGRFKRDRLCINCTRIVRLDETLTEIRRFTIDLHWQMDDSITVVVWDLKTFQPLQQTYTIERNAPCMPVIERLLRDVPNQLTPEAGNFYMVCGLRQGQEQTVKWIDQRPPEQPGLLDVWLANMVAKLKALVANN